MATPATITGITTSSPAVTSAKTSVVRLSDQIVEWQAALSPVGATVYDTGRVALMETPARSVVYRRIGKRVTVSAWGSEPIAAMFAYTIKVAGGTADVQMPVGLRPAERATGTAVMQWSGSGSAWVAPSGSVIIYNSTPTTNTDWYAAISYDLA